MAKIVRKITISQVCGKPDFDVIYNAPGQKIDLMQVFGFGRKARPDSSDFGEFVRFAGSFRAVNLQTSEEFQSGTLILPPVAQDLLAGALSNDEVKEVTFGFKISVHYDKESVTKYVYDVESLVAPAENDPMELLAAQIKTGNLLAAPAEPATAETVMEETASKGKK